MMILMYTLGFQGYVKWFSLEVTFILLQDHPEEEEEYLRAV